jgi:hypothetical protein
MPNFENGKIYKLFSKNQSDKVYIGSTCSTLERRKQGHKNNYKSYLNNKYCYVSSFDIIHFDDADIVLIENYPCNSKDELHKRERYYIENTANCVNRFIPTRTSKQYYEQFRERILDNVNRVIFCECGTKTTNTHKNRHSRTNKHKRLMEEKNKLILPPLINAQ